VVYKRQLDPFSKWHRMFLAVRQGVMNDPLKLFDETENLYQASGSRWALWKLSCVNKSRKRLTWANSSRLEAKRQRWPKSEIAGPRPSSKQED
jgi:hypothetical protein